MDDLEFRSLIPDTELDNKKQPYIDAIKWAINNPEIKNIAITGAYGAGKSSIIDTFIKHKNMEKSTVKISIATFDKESIKNATDEVNNIPIENVLEQQILQQLFYKIEPDKIPFSQFTRINEINKYKALSLISFIFFMCIIGYLILFKDGLNKGLELFISKDINKTILVSLVGISLFVLFTLLIYLCVLIIQKLGLSKFGFGNTSIEVVTKDNNTVFNRYLDEIIYFFQQSKFQYVVFEDLDRFENIGIYERLKGLNIILNGTKQLEKQNITFIYALKDDLFTNNDGKHDIYNRTKFFDFIIPTIKVAHSSNAESLLLSILSNEFISEEKPNGLTKDFIEDIALFINDMRILINICNEYKIYKEALNNNSITLNRLFAFIVYKNIYPGDYSKLLNNDGKLFGILNIRGKIIDQIENDIQEIQHKINLGIQSDLYNPTDIAILFNLKKKEELRYLNKISIHNSSGEFIQSIEAKNSFHPDIIHFTGLFEICMGLKNDFTVHLYRSNHQPITKKGNDFFSTVADGNFLERFKGIYYKSETENLQNDKEELQKKIQRIKRESLSKLIKNGDLESELLENLKSGSELIYFLIRNGWIDESYEDYLSYFYVGSLSNNDMKFLKAVRNGTILEVDFTLSNLSKIIERIKLEDISSNAIFNYNLFEYMIKNSEKYGYKLNKMILHMFNNNDEGIKNYYGFIEYSYKNQEYKIIGDLFNFLKRIDIHFWIHTKDKLDSVQKQNYLYFIISSWNFIIPDEFDLEGLESLKEYTEEQYLPSLYENCSKDCIQKFSDNLNVKYKNISTLNLENCSYILKHNLFEINKINMEHLLQEINIKNAIENELFGIYIEENIETFIYNVINTLDSYIEDETVLTNYLNNEKISDKAKFILVEKYSEKLNDLSKLHSVNEVVRKNKFKSNVNNLDFILNHEDSDSIINFNEIFNNPLNLTELLNDKENIYKLEDDNYLRLMNELIISENIDRDILLDLVGNSFYIMIEPTVISNTSTGIIEKLEALISIDAVYWSIEVYKFIYSSTEKQISLSYLYNAIELYNKDGIQELQGDLVYLNSEGLLPWSEKLVNVLIKEFEFINDDMVNYFNLVSSEVSEEYILRELNGNLPLSTILNFKWNSEKANTAYFIALFKNGLSSDDIKIQINEANYWDKEIYDELFNLSKEYAIQYALNQESQLNDCIFSQEDFDLFTKENFDDNLIINLFNYNKFESSLDFRNWLLKKHRYERIFEFHNSEKVVSSFVKQENISKITKSYIEKANLSRTQIFELFSKLKPPFNSIGLRKGNRIPYSNEENNLELMNLLAEREIVSPKITITEEEIIINNKMK
ncbi:YobI family P-loop NTPase [Solibacillus ferritrahens]|uniref:YobI family P-loop NTPase n=1 Tax=Solibacillus ferritrahens TaxID=3098620 RepID=UPI0030082B27